MNFNIFDPPPAPPCTPPGVLTGVVSIDTAPRDADGLAVPTTWQSSPNWAKLAREVREKWSRIWTEEEIAKDQQERMNAERNQKKPKKRAPDQGIKFTTQYCVNWGKRQCKPSGLSWHVIDRERWERSYKKGATAVSHDLMLGLDVLFDDGCPGMKGYQAGTAGQELAHARTFLERGGPAKAAQRFVKVYWIAFERGNPEPVEGPVEWTENYLRARFPSLFEAAKALQL